MVHRCELHLHHEGKYNVLKLVSNEHIQYHLIEIRIKHTFGGLIIELVGFMLYIEDSSF